MRIEPNAFSGVSPARGARANWYSINAEDYGG
jgi:hypothetical protein